MLFQDIFSIFLPLSIFSFISIVFWSKNPVYGVLSFIVVVLHIVFLLIILDAEFLAYVLAIVYIGAIVVLFLFVVMMFQMKLLAEKRSYFRGCMEYLVVGMLVSFLDPYFSFYLFPPYNDFSQFLIETNFISISAQLLYNDYFYLTVFAGLIMFTGILTSIVVSLKLNSTKKNYIIRNTITSVIKKHV